MPAVTSASAASASATRRAVGQVELDDVAARAFAEHGEEAHADGHAAQPTPPRRDAPTHVAFPAPRSYGHWREDDPDDRRRAPRCSRRRPPPRPRSPRPLTIGAGRQPADRVTPSGTGHVVWSIPVRGIDNAAVGYCRLPPGATGVRPRRRSLFFPSNRGPREVGRRRHRPGRGRRRPCGSSSACYVCAHGDAQEGIQRWTSTDGGTTFAVEPNLGGTPTNAGMGPDGITVAGGVYVTPADGDKVIAPPGHRGHRRRSTPPRATRFVSSPSIVQVPGQNRSSCTRRAISSASAPRCSTGRTSPPTTLMDQGRWTVDQIAPDPRAGHPRAAPDRAARAASG